MKFYIQSLGCPKNLVDSEEVTASFFDDGLELTYNEADAGILVLNTCSFIEASRQESYTQIERLIKLKGSSKKLFVMGCLPEMIRKDLFKKFPQIDGIMGVNRVRDGIKQLLAGEKDFFSSGSWQISESRAILTDPHTVYLKIAEGCNHKCAFCTIPSIRGRYRSRRMEDILNEAKELVANGSKELNLIAQDSTSYGIDLYQEFRLSQLLKELNKLGVWIRVMYMFPAMISDEVIDTIGSSENVVPYFDVPFQHFSSRILELMQRPAQDLDRLVSQIGKLDQSAIRATFICGYPGETEEDFDQLKDFIERSRFDRLALFSYSVEEDTASAKLPGRVLPVVQQDRMNQLYELQSRIIDEKNKQLIGTNQQVLFDSEDVGRTFRDAPDVDGLVEITNPPAEEGSIKTVRITDVQGYHYFGELIK